MLGPFTADEAPIIAAARGRAADCVEWWVRSGLQTAMNRFNTAEPENETETETETDTGRTDARGGAQPGGDAKGATP